MEWTPKKQMPSRRRGINACAKVPIGSRESRFRAADGHWHHILSRGVPIRDSQGKILYWAGINLDIQHRKEAERQLQQLVQTLESRVSERTLERENATAKLRELTGKLLQTQDEERRRIARELHDGVGQLVVAMSMNLTNIVSEKETLSAEARQTLDQNQALIEQGLPRDSHHVTPTAPAAPGRSGPAFGAAMVRRRFLRAQQDYRGDELAARYGAVGFPNRPGIAHQYSPPFRESHSAGADRSFAP
jgi:hypothetical protein